MASSYFPRNTFAINISQSGNSPELSWIYRSQVKQMLMSLQTAEYYNDKFDHISLLTLHGLGAAIFLAYICSQRAQSKAHWSHGKEVY